MDTDEIEWLSTKRSADVLGITPRTLYRFIDDGMIPAYRMGRVIRLKQSDVAQFIENCRIEPGTLDSDPAPADRSSEQEQGAPQRSGQTD